MAIKKYHKSNNVFMGTYSGFVFTSVSEDPTKYNVNTSTNGKTAVIAVQPNTEYTVHKIDTSNRFQVGETPTVPTSSGTLINRIPVEGDNIVTFTTRSDTNYIMVYVSTSTEAATPRLMCNLGATALDYEDYYAPYWEDTTYRRYETATDTITSLPKTIIGDGQPISAYTIKGNMTQSGTPTPQNPIYPTEVGDKTANLFNKDSTAGSIYVTDTVTRYGIEISLEAGTYTVSGGTNTFFAKTKINGVYGEAMTTNSPSTLTLSSSGSILLYSSNSTNYDNAKVGIMLVEGSTAPSSYIPYGFEIPISFNSNTYTFYLSEPIRKIGDSVDTAPSTGTANRTVYKYEFTGNENWQSGNGFFYLGSISPDYLRSRGNITYMCSHYITYQQTPSGGNVPNKNIAFGSDSSNQRIYIRDDDVADTTSLKSFFATQYAAGTPVTVWYVLATPTTEQFTAPTIPTSGSPQSFDVDTTLKPSEVSLTYHGWHKHSDTKFTT